MVVCREHSTPYTGVRITQFLIAEFQLQHKKPQYLTYINPNARWATNGERVAGSDESGTSTFSLSNPCSFYVDYDNAIYIADSENHRIVKWKVGAKNGVVVAGGKWPGDQNHQLNYPTDVIITKERDSLIICDYKNRRVVRWPLENAAYGTIILKDIDCHGLTMDENGFLYVADYERHEVKRYRPGESQVTVVAGGNGKGNRLDQLNGPMYVCIDQDNSLYISDAENHRIVKWIEGAREGIIVAGGSKQGSDSTKLCSPSKIAIDQLKTLYVADWGNHRIVRWPKDSNEGHIIAGGNGEGKSLNQLHHPNGLFIDPRGNLYVSDQWNHRLLKFNINRQS